MEEVAAGVKGFPRRTAACHSCCSCLGDFWKREASSSASLLTRSGACCRFGPSTARGLHPAFASLESWVVRPVGAGRLLVAKEGARLLVDPSLAAQVVSGVLHILLDDTTWEWSKRRLSPANPEASAARVEISNSREVWLSSDEDPCASPVT